MFIFSAYTTRRVLKCCHKNTSSSMEFESIRNPSFYHEELSVHQIVSNDEPMKKRSRTFDNFTKKSKYFKKCESEIEDEISGLMEKIKKTDLRTLREVENRLERFILELKLLHKERIVEEKEKLKQRYHKALVDIGADLQSCVVCCEKFDPEMMIKVSCCVENCVCVNCFKQIQTQSVVLTCPYCQRETQIPIMNQASDFELLLDQYPLPPTFRVNG